MLTPPSFISALSLPPRHLAPPIPARRMTPLPTIPRRQRLSTTACTPLPATQAPPRLSDLISPSSAPPAGHLYFCYGSNLSRAKLRTRGSRDTPPIDFSAVRVARLPHYQLCFDLRGAPPTEPCMGSIRPAPADHVYGLVYTLRTTECWKKLLASEGVSDTPQTDGYWVVDVEVECDTPGVPGGKEVVVAKTLVTNPSKSIPEAMQTVLRPSERYMGILINGAELEGLPREYVERLRAVRTARKWPASSVLLRMMVFVVPFLFLSRALKVGFLAAPLRGIGARLYIAHESVVTLRSPSIVQRAKLGVAKIGIFLLYGFYALPTILLLLLSPRARMFAKRITELVKTEDKRQECVSKEVKTAKSQ